MTSAQLASIIDHTNLKANATQHDIAKLCDEAIEFGFHAVSVNPSWTAFCAKRLEGTRVVVDATVGFPLGANTAKMKVREAREAAENGAREIDVVINIGAAKSAAWEYVAKEIETIVRSVPDALVKVILETSYLNEEEKVRVCDISRAARAAFVKTSTGFGESGATVDDVRLLRRTVGKDLGVKAAGGIRGYLDTVAMIRAGANRIGTSAGVQIVNQIPKDEVELAS